MVDIDFSLTGELDILALYAAVLSTLIAFWEYKKWRARYSVDVSCTPNMLFMPSVDDKKFIVARATNKGSTSTTITHFMGYYWDNFFDKIFDRNRRAFIVNEPNTPVVIQPGEQWMGRAEQTPELEEMARKGYLYMGIMHSMGEKELLVRVSISDEEHKNEDA